MDNQKEVQSNKKQQDKAIKMAILCLLLFLLSICTTIILVEKLGDYADKMNTPTIDIEINENVGSGNSDGSGGNGSDNSGEEDNENKFIAKPGFKVQDGQKVWTTETDVDIFNRTYTNNKGEVTVHGNGHKIIAPGTANNYTFQCVNTGNTAMDYTVVFEVEYSNSFDHIPVLAKLTDSTGRVLTGLENGWVSIEYLNGMADTKTLAANRHINYTLSWQWPYEGDDHYDTALGDIAVKDDLRLTVRIKTIATENPDPNAGVGDVNTSDNSNIAMWASLMVLSFVGLVIIALKKPKEESEELNEN